MSIVYLQGKGVVHVVCGSMSTSENLFARTMLTFPWYDGTGRIQQFHDK